MSRMRSRMRGLLVVALALAAAPVVYSQSVPPEANGLVQAVFQRSLHDFGKVYQWQRALSGQPDLLAATDEQYRRLMLSSDELTQLQRARIAAVISQRNGDESHLRVLREYLSSLPGGGAPDVTDGAYQGKNLPKLDEAILAFAVKLHDTPGAVTDGDVARLRELGLPEASVTDIGALVALVRRINEATVAARLPIEPPNAGEGIVRGRSYPIPFERGDSHYDALVAASDGKVYFACCTHHIATHAQFYSFDPRTKQVTHLADIGDVVGEKDLNAITQGKVHSYLIEHQGKLWFTTFKGWYKEDLQGRRPYPGGHFVSYDLKTGKFQSVAKVPEGEGVPTCALDPVHGKLYGITYPSGHLYAYDLKTRRLECIERGKLNYGCAPSVDPQGRLYLSRTDGSLWRYDPSLPRDRRMTMLLADTQAAAYGPAQKGSAVELFWHHADGKVYGMHRGTSSLSLYDPVKQLFTPLGRLSAGEKRRCVVNFRGTSPGLPRAADGTFYHVTVGPALADPPRPTLKYNCYLTSYNPATRAARNHGAIYLENDRRLLYNAAGTLSHDGKNFTTIGWVEVNDPAEVERVQRLRREASPPETSGRVYELRVVEIPLP